MPETLVAHTPLGSREDAPPKSFVQAHRVHLVELPFGRAFALQFDAFDASRAAAMSRAVGLELAEPNRTHVTATTSAFWLGPGDWLIRPGADGDPLFAGLDNRVAADGGSLVDVSDLWFGIGISGSHARDLLAKACALDLDPTVFPPGASAVAQVARLRALIHHVDGTPFYHVYVERSYAAYIWDWFVDATREFLDYQGDAG
jgi:sarcosine oxidase subunit gamma